MADGSMKFEKLVNPGHTFGDQELLQTLCSIKSAPATIFHAAVRQDGLIMDSHAIDVYSAIKC